MNRQIQSKKGKILSWLIAGFIIQVLLFQSVTAEPQGGYLSTSMVIYGFDKKSASPAFRAQFYFPTESSYIKPILGTFVTGQRGVYTYGGISLHLDFLNRFIITTAFAPGFYWRGNDLNLGGVIEFESSLIVGYRMSENFSFSVGISHLSNAGIYSYNPGVETLSFNYFFQF